MFEFQKTKIEGVQIIKPHTFQDDRGILKKTYEKTIFEEHGICFTAAEELETTSKKGVLRGIHYQTRHSQGKLMRVVRGAIYDVAVDLRPQSPTFLESFGMVLSEENQLMIYIPEGFGHGCLALKDETTFYYLCSRDYQPGYDTGIRYDDPQLAIPWPVEEVGEIILSEKDKNLPGFSERAPIFE